jgi:hypothetical protein
MDIATVQAMPRPPLFLPDANDMKQSKTGCLPVISPGEDALISSI